MRVTAHIANTELTLHVDPVHDERRPIDRIADSEVRHLSRSTRKMRHCANRRCGTSVQSLQALSRSLRNDTIGKFSKYHDFRASEQTAILRGNSPSVIHRDSSLGSNTLLRRFRRSSCHHWTILVRMEQSD